MDSIFGISMNWILVVLAGVVLLGVLSVAMIGIFNPIVFKMALRNPPRRKAQTILIVIGLMLATLVTSAALTTGDTLDYSMKKSAYDSLNRVDVSVGFVGEAGGEGGLSVTSQPVPESLADDLSAQFADDPDFEAFMPVLTVDVPVVNSQQQLSEPAAILTGLKWDSVEQIGGIERPDGSQIDPGEVPSGAAVISETLAETTGTQPGDTITIYVDNQPAEVSVYAVGQDSILTGLAFGQQGGPSNNGLAMALDDVQRLTGLEGQARYIAVTLSGGVEGSVAHSNDAEAKLARALDGQPYGVNPVKREAVEAAEQSGSQFVSFFLILGLFSIAAGVLLIFLIFTMLASERRSEMGMARAVGMRQGQLVQQFVAEGAVYDVGAALVGALAGVGVAFAMVGLLGEFIGGAIDIEPRWTFRSLAVAYALGVTVTFITILFASGRAARLNIVSAIRDLPEPAGKSGDRPVWTWWKKLPRSGPQIPGSGLHWISLLWFPLELLPNLALYPVRLVVWVVRLVAHYAGWGTLLTPLGLLLMLSGWMLAGESGSFALYSIGLSLLGFGLMLILRRWLPQRAVFTTISATLLLWWLAPEGTFLARIFATVTPADLEGDFEMFFISGIMMITYSTLLVMWNAEIIVWLVSLFGKLFNRWVPSVKTAVAYPMASKTKTGLTLAMFSLVIFSLVMMATLNANFRQLFATEGATGGWDVQVQTSTANPVDDFPEALGEGDVATAEFTSIGRTSVIVPENSQIRLAGEAAWGQYTLNGVNPEFARNTDMPLKVRAAGYESDEAVWEAIASDPTVAVIDPFAVDAGGGPFGGGEDQFRLTGVDASATTMQPVEVTIGAPDSGERQTIQVIGVIDDTVSTAQGLYLNQQTVIDLYGGADRETIYVQLADDSLEHSQEVARQIESALVEYGVQAESTEEQVQEAAEASTSFMNLVQGFMGLGLLVGIAALGVISFRAVVERRQQIGMLRAIGFQRGMVATSLLIESLVVAGLGILAGLILGLTLAYDLLSTGELQPGADFSGFVIPWGRLGAMIAVALGAATIMTLIPSRNAASVPVAEALRYE